MTQDGFMLRARTGGASGATFANNFADKGSTKGAG